MERFLDGLDGETPQTDVTKDDPITTEKIALAHLNEFPDYYTRPARMERTPKASQAKAKLSRIQMASLCGTRTLPMCCLPASGERAMACIGARPNEAKGLLGLDLLASRCADENRRAIVDLDAK